MGVIAISMVHRGDSLLWGGPGQEMLRVPLFVWGVLSGASIPWAAGSRVLLIFGLDGIGKPTPTL